MERPTVWQWLKSTWKPLLLGFVGLIILLVATALISHTWKTEHLYVRPMWPTRVSSNIESTLLVNISKNDTPDMSGAQVELYQLTGQMPRYYGDRQMAKLVINAPDRLKKLATGTTDKRGMVSLTLPKATKVNVPPNKDTTNKRTRSTRASDSPPMRRSRYSNHRRSTKHNFFYILKVKHKGSVRYLSKRLESGVDHALVAITLDRPLYQPGQEVKMRALFLDSDENKPASGMAMWRVKDPQGNLIFEEQKPLSTSGITHTSCALAREGVQGTYTLEIEHNKKRHTKQFDVRPFKLPKFKVEVVPLTKQAEVGKSLKAQVIVTYNHGERVKDAKTTIRIKNSRLGIAQYAALEGKTDKRGIHEFSWTLPTDADTGGAVQIEASAITATGHAQQGKASIPVAGDRISLELLPLNASSFRWDHTNRGVFLLKNGRNQPIANAKVKFFLPEAKTEREVSTTTDTKGRATFEWLPSSRNNNKNISLEVTTPDGRVIRKTTRAKIIYAQDGLKMPKLIATEGKPFSFEAKGYGAPSLVIVYRQGLPLQAITVPKTTGYNKLSVTFDGRARGLVYLVALNPQGDFISSTPVVVEQKGSANVSIKTDKVLYAPGTQAKVQLGFDPYVGQNDKPKGDKPPVTFGLVGVDEALYTLKARTDMSLKAIMRRDPKQVNALVQTLQRLDQGDALSVEIASTRFKQTLGGNYNPYNKSFQNQRDFTRNMLKEQAKTRKKLWIVFLSLLILGLSVLAARSTWAGFTRKAFGWKRLGALIGCALLVLPIMAILGSMGRDRSIMGGLFVWGLVLGSWLIGAAWRQPDSQFGKWLWIILGMAGLGVFYALTLDGMGSSTGWIKTVVGITAIGSLALMSIQLVLWPFTLIEHGEARTGYALATLYALPAIGVMSVFGSSFNPRRVYEKGGDMVSATRMSAPGRAKSEEPEAAPRPVTKAPPRQGQNTTPAKNQPRVRSYFPETMVWVPEVLSDAQGKATINVEVPDSITTWRLNAWAHTWDGRLGEGQAAMKVWQDFFVEVNVPMDLIQGDVIDVPVTLVNNKEQASNVTLSVQTDNDTLRVLSNANQTMMVDAGARKTLYLRMAAGQPGTGSVTVFAKTAGPTKGDAIKHSITVHPDGRVLRHSGSGFIQDGYTQTMALPRDAIDGSFDAQVKLFPSPLADALDGLDGMVRRPYGCFEQTSSANYPNVIITQALKDIKPADWPSGAKGHAKLSEKTKKLLSIGYQRMLTFQKPSGGFALYPKIKTPDVMLTAYGVIQLSKMKQVHTIDDLVLKRAISYLIRNQNSNGTWPAYASRISGGSSSDRGDVGQVRSTSFVVLALIESPLAKQYKAQIKRSLDHIEKRFTSVSSPNALALAANALWLGGRKEAAKRVMGVLAASIKTQNNQSYWNSTSATWIGGRSRYADIETTAIAAYVFNKSATTQVNVGNVLQYLASRRSYYGGWGSTQATVWTLRTLLSVASNVQQKATIDLKIDGQPMAHANGRGEPGVTNVDSKSVLIQQFSSQKMDAGDHTLTIKPRQGKSASVAQLIHRYAVPWKSPFANVKGEHFGLTMTKTNTATFGQRVTATATLVNLRPVNIGATIMEVPLPPGAYAPTAQFDQLQQAGRIDHYEILPTHVRLYIKGVRASGQLKLVYHFIPLLRGKVSLPPARAYVFYTPEPVTEIDPGDLSID